MTDDIGDETFDHEVMDMDEDPFLSSINYTIHKREADAAKAA